MSKYTIGVIIYIVLGLLIALGVAQVPAASNQRLFIHTLNGQRLTDLSGTQIKSYSFCLNEYDESVVGPDDYIYGYQFSSKQVFRQDILTGLCEPIGPPAGDNYNPVKGLRFSPSERYLYAIVGSISIIKLDLQTLEWLPCLDSMANVFYQGIDFQIDGYLLVTYSDQSDSSFGHMVFEIDPFTDAFNSTAFYRMPWFADYGAPVKCMSCPAGYTGNICCTSYNSGQFVQAHAFNNDVWSILMDATSPATTNGYFLYYNALPWPQIYATGSDANLYAYNVSATIPYTDRVVLRKRDDTFHFHTFIAPPTVGNQWIGRSKSSDQWCKRQISYFVYDWTNRTTVEVALSRDYPYKPGGKVSVSPPQFQQLFIDTEIDCSNRTNVARVRVQYYGADKTVIRSIPVEVECVTAPAECLVKGTVQEITPASQSAPNIIPILECISPTSNNAFLGYFGFNNMESSFLNVPVGPLNYFVGEMDRGQTTNFLTGRSEFFPRGAFTSVLTPGTYTWILTNYNLTFDTADTTRYCPKNFSVGVQLTNSTVIGQSELNIMELNIAEQLNLDPAQVSIQGIKVVQAKKRAGDTLSELEVEISSQSPNSSTQADPQQVVQNFITTVANATTAQEVFNPLNDTSREIIGVKTRPTGVETEGKQIPQAPVQAPMSISTASRQISLDFTTVISFLFAVLSLFYSSFTSSLDQHVPIRTK